MPTIPCNLSPYGWTLAATLRQIVDAGAQGAVRIEHKPASPFAGDPEFDSTDLSDWTQANSSNVTSIDANTTRKGHLHIDGSATLVLWFNAARSSPHIYQTISGNFDIYSCVSFGQLNTNNHNICLIAQSTSDATDWVKVNFSGASAAIFSAQFGSTVNDSTGNTATAELSANNLTLNSPIWLRLKRATNEFSGYYSLNGTTWTQVGSTATRSDFSADQKLGMSMDNNNTGNTYKGSFDFVRTWPPFDTTSPAASKVFDSGISGTTWDMSTFIALENEFKEYSPQSGIGFGTLKYQYGAGNSDPPTLNGSWLTATQMASESDPTGRYFNLSAQFNSASGYELSSFNGARIDTVISAGGVLIPGGMVGGFRG